MPINARDLLVIDSVRHLAASCAADGKKYTSDLLAASLAAGGTRPEAMEAVRIMSARQFRRANRRIAEEARSKRVSLLGSDVVRRIAERIRLRRTPVLVPLGEAQERVWLAAAKAAWPRYKEWSLGAEASLLQFSGGRALRETGSNSNWNKRSTFRRGIRVTSYATCPGGKVAILRLGTETHRVPAPRGYWWDIDQNGLALFGAAGEYHPTASELLDGPKVIVAALKAAAAKRREAAREAKRRLSGIRKAEREGARVCMRDSLRAGNCYAGSVNWARNHNLDPAQHVKPSELLARANGDASRVALVVAVALKRHRNEMERGFCDLADHR